MLLSKFIFIKIISCSSEDKVSRIILSLIILKANTLNKQNDHP